MNRPSPAPIRSLVGAPKSLGADRQRKVLIAALLASVVEILGLLGGLGDFTVGRIVLSPSVVPGIVIVGLLGRRCLGRSRGIDAASPFWVAAVLGLVFGGVMLAREQHRIDVLGILLASANEEVIYRFAVPTVIAAILIALKVRAAPARMAGFGLAAIWFVLLPGHRAQMTDASQVMPFVAFAALAAFVVYRSGSFAATAAAHSVVNMFTILALGGGITLIARSAGMACLLILLVAAYSQPARRKVAAGVPAITDLTAPLERGEIIDLRDGVTPTHTDAEGAAVPLADKADADKH